MGVVTLSLGRSSRTVKAKAKAAKGRVEKHTKPNLLYSPVQSCAVLSSQKATLAPEQRINIPGNHFRNKTLKGAEMPIFRHGDPLVYCRQINPLI